MDLLVRGGTVVTCDGERRILSPGDVLVQGGRIARVAARIAPPRGRPCRIVDAAGCALLPGLIQTHVHLCQTLLRGMADDLPLLTWLRTRVWPFEAALGERDLAASVALGTAELLRGGTTAVLDMGTVRHHDAVFETVLPSRLRLTSGKAMMDAGDGVPEGLRERTRESLAESERLLARWHGAGEGRLRYAFAPRFILSCSEGLLRSVADLSRARGVLVHTHASENLDELVAVRARSGGAGNVAHLARLGLAGPHVCLAHCIWVDDAELNLLAQTHTRVLHCPSSNLKLGSGIAPVPEMLARGICVSLGADGAPCNNNLDAFQEMRLAALIHKPRAGAHSIGAREALDLATRAGAEALGLLSEIGSLEAGKRGDLVVVDLSGLHCGPGGDVVSRVVYAARAHDVRDVFIDGVPVVLRQALKTLDEERVRAVAAEALARVLARVAWDG